MPRDPPPEKNLFSHHTYHADCNHNGYGADYDGKVIKPHKIGQIADEPNSTLIKAAFLSYLPKLIFNSPRCPEKTQVLYTSHFCSCSLFLCPDGT